MQTILEKHTALVDLLKKYFKKYDPQKINPNDKKLNEEAVIDLKIILAKYEDLFMSLEESHLYAFEKYLGANNNSFEKIKDDAVTRCGNNGVALLMFYSSLLTQYSNFILTKYNN